MKYLVQEKTKTVITCFQTEILCVSPSWMYDML